MFAFEDAEDVTVTDCWESCPIPGCGGIGKLQDGTYDFIGKTLVAFRAPEVTRESIERFVEIAQSLQSGDISPEDASNKIEKLGTNLSSLWQWTNNNAAALSLIVAIANCFLAYYLWDLSRASDTELTHSIQENTEVRTKELEILKKIYDEIQLMGVKAPDDLEPAPPELEFTPARSYMRDKRSIKLRRLRLSCSHVALAGRR
ncbi:hypothetical protein [Novosphingobium sp. PC22D]|uniref:hypothetical protein n=1 Tax=Novosphingobium sp. PC22D TaxID=1962403 RepID=UPI0011453AE3|nr:hypothetical protein [Novosphingobium sp. PC22D]